MAASSPAQTAITSLSALAEQVENAETLDQVSDLVRPYFDPDGGVLNHVASVMWAVAGHAEAHLAVFRDDDPAYALWHQLAAAAENLGDLRDATGTAPQALLLIDPVIPEQSPMRRAALATSPAHATAAKTGTCPAPAAPTQPPTPPAATPGR